MLEYHGVCRELISSSSDLCATVSNSIEHGPDAIPNKLKPHYQHTCARLHYLAHVLCTISWAPTGVASDSAWGKAVENFNSFENYHHFQRLKLAMLGLSVVALVLQMVRDFQPWPKSAAEQERPSCTYPFAC